MDDTVVDTGDVEVKDTETVNTDTGGDNADKETPSIVEEPVLDIKSIKLPEGMSVSEEDESRLLETVKRFGIKDQESLQGFVDWALETVKENDAILAKQKEESEANAAKEWEDIKSGWRESLKGDADFGKEYDLNIKRANDTIDRFGGSELKSWLKDADLTEHPAVLKTFARIGKEIEDAKLIVGNKGIETTGVKRDRYNQPMLVYKD